VRYNRVKYQALSNSVNDLEFDLAVIGAGPVGVKASILAASKYGKKVALIDAPRASGVLINEESGQDLSIGGPTGLFSKALRDTSKQIRVQSLRGMGLREDSIWNEIINSCEDLAKLNSDEVFRQLEYNDVEYVEGFASFHENGDTETIVVSPLKREIKAKHILIATGSKPFQPSLIPFDGERIFDSDSINQLSYLPSSIAITGSGIIAIEFAKIFRNLGAEVTLIIRGNRPRDALMNIGLDRDVASTLVADLVQSGIKFERNAQVKSIEISTQSTEIRGPIKILLEAKGGMERSEGCATEIKCDAYLAAVGRTPMTKTLNLESAGIETDEFGGLKVDGTLKTTAKNVYGAGDVLGRPFLASTGVVQGTAVVEHLYGGHFPAESSFDSSSNENDSEPCIESSLSSTGENFDPASLSSNPFAFPTGIWSTPEAAYFGLSKEQAEARGIEVGEGIALYCQSLRGLVFNPTGGLLKLVYEKASGQILGVHICGNDACELIHYGMELVKGRKTIHRLIDNLYSAVTYHELYSIAANAAIDEAGARKNRAAAGRALAARNRATKRRQLND